MQITREQLTPTTVRLTVAADPAFLANTKTEVLQRLGRQMKVAGFRPGKAPLPIIEKQADPSTLQSQFLDAALNHLYGDALDQEKLRPVAQPNLTIQTFVPFSTLEFVAEVEAIGDIKLPDYTKIKLPKPTAGVTAKDVDEVVHTLQQRAAERKAVDRAAKNGDETTIDFNGKDAKTDEPVKGADGQGYPLLLGSDTFIPGFETNLVGMKAGETKTFVLTFPKDYGVAALQNRKVSFTVTVTKVQEVAEPKLDDAFAAKVGPFKSLAALREDIRKQLSAEKQREADRAYENELIEKIAAGTTVAIPSVLIDEEVQRAEAELRQNLAYRGQTWPEYLQELGQSEVDYRASLRGPAELRVKAGLALTEIAEREHLSVTPEELSIRLQLLKGQYQDKTMQAELEKPANVRSIMSGMLSDKTIATLVDYATAADKAAKPAAKG
ncbi:MAG TPA: trigger factor [Candidatus Saccharimonadales bacterium]|nr:trigger factor [Candidatus Saccharimonadales bacterium]